MGFDRSDSTQLIWLPLDLPGGELEAMAQWLSPDERERAARFRFARDRNRYIACRAGVRIALGQFLDRDPDALQFRYGPHGKPALDPTRGAPAIQFNVSHSQGMGVLAVQVGDEVGVDIEAARAVPDALAIAERLFAEEECRALAALPPEGRDVVFARYWTRKEALLKSIGRGLSYPASTFIVPPGELTDPVEVALPDGSARQARWLLPTPSPSGYVTAIATAGGPRPVHGVAPALP